MTAQRMRVTFLTQYFVPEVGAAPLRIAALADGLAPEAAVTVHTCPPHYPSGTIPRPYRNVPLARERHGAVHVVRSAVYPARNAGVIRRLADHASFSLTAIATAPAAGSADIVVAETPPLFVAAAGVLYARLKRASLVLHVADRWPATAIELGMLRHRPLVKAAEALERWSYRHARAVAVPTAPMAERLAELPETEGKVRIMPPSVDLERFEHPRERAPGALRALYAGTTGLGQGVATLVLAAARLDPAEVEVTIAGDGAEAADVRALVGSLSLPHVHVLGPVPHEDVPNLYRESDVAVVLLRDREVFREAFPTKLLEAMAAGRPLVVSARGAAADEIVRLGAGLAVAPEDPAALAATLRRLAADPSLRARLGENGRRAATASFGRPRAVERWLALLREVAQERQDAPRASFWRPRSRGLSASARR